MRSKWERWQRGDRGRVGGGDFSRCGEIFSGEFNTGRVVFNELAMAGWARRRWGLIKKLKIAVEPRYPKLMIYKGVGAIQELGSGQ